MTLEVSGIEAQCLLVGEPLLTATVPDLAAFPSNMHPFLFVFEANANFSGLIASSSGLGSTTKPKQDLLSEPVVPKTQPEKIIPKTAKTITNSLGMKFVLIPAGTFMMGSPSDEPDRNRDEDQHKVTISKPFFMQTTEVTQGQWRAIMGNNPSYFDKCGDDCPVEYISWDDCQEFIRKLNQTDGTNKYRLPTEAQWEYACRAETQTAFSFGRCLSGTQANYRGTNYPMRGCAKGQQDRERTVVVGSFKPNAWGLHDMHGNAWEWCQDSWDYQYPSGHVTDPQGPSGGSDRVLRGGSWLNKDMSCRSACRDAKASDYSYGDVGLRLASTP